MNVAVHRSRRKRGTGLAPLRSRLRSIDPDGRDEFLRRAAILLAALGHPTRQDEPEILDALAEAMVGADHAELWLMLAVLTSELPNTRRVVSAHRSTALEGPVPTLLEALREATLVHRIRHAAVEVVTDRTVVDVHHTVGTALATGIQRVVRETVRRWSRDHDPLLVGWTDDYRSMRPLTARERGEFSKGGNWATAADDRGQVGSGGASARAAAMSVVVPWRCTVLVPELAAEGLRADRYQAMARFSGCSTGLIGFDCVPLMAAETSAEGMAAGFASYLAAAAHFDRLAAISDAAAIEFLGWRVMLGGSGRTGPDVRAIPLAVEGREPSAAALETAEELLTVGALPVVLAVGSHEPRKNHMAVLAAAEILWQEGLQFSLTFVGGNAWKSESFTDQVRTLQEVNRPVQAILAMSDELLWAAYRVAYCTVFVSLHEGYGLPAAESLASGTPVVTSNFGSMLQIAERGGALLVDPSDDVAIADALRRLLNDPGLRERLASRARSLSWRTWDDYAAEAWAFLTEGDSMTGSAVAVEQSAEEP